MKLKKLVSFVMAAVMAAGICVGVPGVPSGETPMAITAEASKYTENGFEITVYSGGNWKSKEVTGYSGKGGDIVIPDGVDKVASTGVFKDNDTITSVTFPESCEDIAQNAFENCKKLKSITFEGDADCWHESFINCPNLKSVKIQGNATFGYEAFKGCTSLESVIVKGKIDGDIQRSAFENCTSLKTFKIYKMDTVDNLSWWVQDKAFKNCKNLTSITIPNNCSGIVSEAFKNCISLETVKISGKMKDTDGKPLVVNTIWNGSYYFTIGESAFENCYSLKSINILKRTFDIKEKAFLNCYSLSELKISSETTFLRDYSVGYIYSGGKYSVADGKKTVTYTNAAGEKVKVKPKQITLTVPYISNAECYYANKNNIKYKYTDGTSPSSIPAPKCTLTASFIEYYKDYYKSVKYLTIDTSDGADFYRIYIYDDPDKDGSPGYYDTAAGKMVYTDKYGFYKDVTSANNLEVTWGTYIVVAYYKDKNGNYTTSRPSDWLS